MTTNETKMERDDDKNQRLTPRAVGNAENCGENTDKELWREREGNYYADSIHVTKDGGIGINCGGFVIVKPLKKWFALAHEAPHATGNAEPQEWTIDLLEGHPVLGIDGGHTKYSFPKSHAVQVIAIKDAHNAAIERAKTEAHQDGWHEGQACIDTLNNKEGT